MRIYNKSAEQGDCIDFYPWDDPLGYDVTFDTSRLSPESVVESIVVAAKDPYLKEAQQVIFGPENLSDTVRLAFITLDDAIIELYEET